MDIRFYVIGNKADKQGDCPIQASIISNGQRLQVSVGHKINPRKWDAEKQCVLRGAVNAKNVPSNIINAALDKIRYHFGRMDDVLNTYTKEDLVQEFDLCMHREGKKKEPSESVDILMTQFYLSEGAKNGWAVATYNKFKAIQKHLSQIKPGLKLKEIDEGFLNQYIQYFLDQGFTNSTIQKYLKLLRWFLRWADDHGHPVADDYKSYKSSLKQPNKEVIFLDWDELMAVYNQPLKDAYLDRARDVFCFLCFTGLRYSDVANLRRSDVFPDHIQVTTIKTVDNLTIELNDYAKTLLKKYEGEKYPGNLALPVISPQRMNDYLREVGKAAGLDTAIRQVYFSGNKRIEITKRKYELLTTHCGRRTFICNALALGIPAEIVMRWTGHSDYSSMKPYIAITDKAKASEMQKFNR